MEKHKDNPPYRALRLTVRTVRRHQCPKPALSPPMDLLNLPGPLPGSGSQGVLLFRLLPLILFLSIPVSASPLFLPGYSSHGYLNIDLEMSKISTDFS